MVRRYGVKPTLGDFLDTWVVCDSDRRVQATGRDLELCWYREEGMDSLPKRTIEALARIDGRDVGTRDETPINVDAASALQ